MLPLVVLADWGVLGAMGFRAGETVVTAVAVWLPLDVVSTVLGRSWIVVAGNWILPPSAAKNKYT